MSNPTCNNDNVAVSVGVLDITKLYGRCNFIFLKWLASHWQSNHGQGVSIVVCGTNHHSSLSVGFVTTVPDISTDGQRTCVHISDAWTHGTCYAHVLDML
jgi:hypothetical protein